MAWTSPRTWVAGEKPSAATYNTHIRDNFKAIGDPWPSYTPTVGAWTVNNGVVTASAVVVGKLILGQIKYVVGSTDTKAGTITFTLPAAPLSTLSIGATLGTAGLVDTSAAARAFRIIRMAASSEIVMSDEAGASVTNTVPWTWATGDEMYLSFQYQAA